MFQYYSVSVFLGPECLPTLPEFSNTNIGLQALSLLMIDSLLSAGDEGVDAVASSGVGADAAVP